MSESPTDFREGTQRPYRERRLNFLYNLLFCDELSLFRPVAEPPWSTLFADPPNVDTLHALAHDESAEGRVRALAFNRLRALGQAVTPRILLGVIVEVPLELGLDTLAAYRDGGVRYLNQGGKVVVIDGDDVGRTADITTLLIKAAQLLVNVIGPITGERKPPPPAGNVRMTFVVSDGLYTAEGSFATFQQDAHGGPVLNIAGALLRQVVDLAKHHDATPAGHP